ncbi:MAG: hypothetical protein QUS13_06945 [Smithella sp.]|nr:hypothetical protein [Smithella sp.]
MGKMTSGHVVKNKMCAASFIFAVKTTYAAYDGAIHFVINTSETYRRLTP